MNKLKLTASLALWRGREIKRYRLWKKSVKLHPSGNATRKRHYKEWEEAHTMVRRRIAQIANYTISHVSDAGSRKIADREGVIPYAYNDSRGFATAWIGHLIAQRPVNAADLNTWGSKSHPAALDRVYAYFKKDLAPYEKAVRQTNQQRIKAGHVSITQAQFDALVSFCFNIGVGGFATSTAAKLIVSGAPRADVAAAMMRWNKPPEIRGRRQQEANAYAA